MPSGPSQHRQGERRNVIGAFLTLFLILSAHVMTETARDALFLAELSAAELPWVYLGIAVAAFFIAGQAIQAGRRAMAVSLWASALVTLGFWWLIDPRRSWTFYALYVWSGVFGSIAIAQFWLLLSRLFTVGDAKRLYGLIGAGSVLGAFAGAGCAAALVTMVPAEDLLLVSAGILALAGAGPFMLSTRNTLPTQRAFRSTATECWRTIRTHPYIRRLALFVVVGTVALTLVDFLFKAQVEAEFASDKDALVSFFAVFYTALNGLALLAQLALTGVLIRRLGVQRALWVLPTLIALGSFGLIAGGGLVAAMVLKSADGSLKHSLNRTVTEVLYLPIPARLRRHSKSFIDVMGARGAQAVASLIILAAVGLGVGTEVLAVATGVLALAWLYAAKGLKKHYLQLFRESLKEGAIQTRVDMPELDLGALEALLRALNSDDDREVLSALNLLASEGRTNLIPALILHHPADEIVQRALDLFAEDGRSDFLRLADRLIQNGSPVVRAAALRARTRVEPNIEVLERAAADPEVLVRATAIVGLAVHGGKGRDEARAELLTLARSSSREARLAVTAAVTEQPDECLCDVLMEMARSEDKAVAIAAARAMVRVKSPRLVETLIAMLERRGVRAATREALVAIGPPALDALRVALDDESLPAGLRLHLPRTVSRFAPMEAAPILLNRLLVEPSSAVRYKILRGLGRLRASHPDLVLDRRKLDAAVERLLRFTYQLLGWHSVLAEGAARDQRLRTAGQDLLVTMLRDKTAHAVERLFRILGLIHPREDLHRVYKALTSDDRAGKDNARELLGYLLGPQWREAVLALVADLDDAARLERGSAFADTRRLTYTQVLAQLLESPADALRALAAYHAGELQLADLRGALERVEVAPTSYAAQVVRRALALFDRTDDDKAMAHAT